MQEISSSLPSVLLSRGLKKNRSMPFQFFLMGRKAKERQNNDSNAEHYLQIYLNLVEEENPRVRVRSSKRVNAQIKRCPKGPKGMISSIGFTYLLLPGKRVGKAAKVRRIRSGLSER